jgi:hypothetical protein
MKRNITNLSIFVKQALIDDLLDRYLLLASLSLFLLDMYIWRAFLYRENVIFLKINIYPVDYLAIVVIVNTILSVAAHDNEKEVGYLLLMGNIIVGLLIFALEIFYLMNIR